MNETELDYNPNPLENASVWSKLTFSWIKPMLKLGRSKQLQLNDLYNPHSDDEARPMVDQLENEWELEIKKKREKASLLRTIFRLYGWQLFFNGLLIIIEELTKILQPLLISMVLVYFNGGIEREEALIYGSVISVCAVIGGILHHPYYFNSWRIGMKIRVAASGLMYRKIFRLSVKALDSNFSGDIINLLSTDATRIEIGVLYLPYLFIGPIQIVIVITVILQKIGVWFLAGLLLLLLIVPIQALVAKAFNNYRAKLCVKTDERISMLTETLNNIKIIKMYCWEKPFTDRLTKARNNELFYQACLNLLQSVSASIDTIMSTLITFVNITCFLHFTNAPLVPSFVVFSIGFYMKLCNSIGFNFTRALNTAINGLVSCKRVNAFLMQKELDLTCFTNYKQDDEKNVSINVKNLNFNWNQESDVSFSTTSTVNHGNDGFSLRNISFNVNPGELVTIVGPVASGKSTLMLALLAELKTMRGNVDVKGKIFYVSQQPWVFTASIKQNIIFGHPYDKTKFDKIVEVCSLKKDLELLSFGMNTLVGEKGINLSGGQRARICIARALYSDADIFLFDDSLSAVDATVGKNILNNCINGYLKNKIRIMITAHVNHLESANNIIVMNNGIIEAQGDYKTIIRSNIDSIKSLSKGDEAKDENEETPDKKDKPINQKLKEELRIKEALSKKEREETMQEGSVSWKLYLDYFFAGGGILGTSLVVVLFFAAQAMMVACDYWLFVWATREENYLININQKEACLQDETLKGCNATLVDYSYNQTVDEEIRFSTNRNESYKFYLIMSALSLVLVCLRSVFYFLLCVRCSKVIYEKLFNSVKNTPIKFFELNPIGRIVNRFSRDTNNMDDLLVSHLYEFLQVLMIILGALAVPIIVKWQMAFPLIPLGIVFYFLKEHFVPSARELKRLDNIARSPVFVHTSNTIEGIAIIRASGTQETLCREFELHNDNHSRAFFGFLAAHRWFGLRLDFLCSLYAIITLFGYILFKDYIGLDTGRIGLVMCYLLQLFDLFQWCVVLNTYIENLMTSIERIIEYTNLPSEPLAEGKRKPPVDWPSKGEITFQDVSLSYDANLPNVLKRVSLSIGAHEKIGIVGRTGAGKSSFFQTIFRMYEPNGRILIDGVNIQELSLKDLRSKLTIIPQEPILFSGSLRMNLDPFQDHDDLDLWTALEAVNLKEFVSEIDGRLDHVINSGGSNISVGQKQLICLARAILKKTKVLIIDEATANVDFKTDALIQNAIREHFKDCTVLTIAHRLSTIVDNDRIICLSEGVLKNFGRPHTLLYDEKSVLHELTKKLSSVEKKVIYDIVNANIERFEKSNLEQGYVPLRTAASDSKSGVIQSPANSDSSSDEQEKKSILQKGSSITSYGATKQS